MKRRTLLTAGAVLLLPGVSSAQQAPAALPAELAPDPTAFSKIMADFTRGATPEKEGLALDMSMLADNPSAVPVKVRVTLPITEQDWCEEIIVLAALNPSPLACRLRFTQAAGTAEAAVRVRLSQSQTVYALARMKSGKLLSAQQAVIVAASGCGM
ncbi:MAG: thiosulfate oxidation carrier protein SoxY [Pigmentiphaga sp.]